MEKNKLTKSYDFIVGIDPDVDRSGVALLNTRTDEISIFAMTFPELLVYFGDLYANLDVITVVEGGWLNRSNWHLTRHDTLRSAAKKGEDVGRCHEVGRKIVELLQASGLPVEVVKPHSLVWRDGKISHQELVTYVPVKAKRSNQEQRDAALIAWLAAEKPLRPRKKAII